MTETPDGVMQIKSKKEFGYTEQPVKEENKGMKVISMGVQEAKNSPRAENSPERTGPSHNYSQKQHMSEQVTYE